MNKSPQLVKVAVKTPLLEQPLIGEQDGELTLEKAVDRFLASPAVDVSARRVQAQLVRERTGDHDYIAFTADGKGQIVSPRTRLLEIAVPKELVHPATGKIEQVSIAAFEVQSYAKVGR
jgi:hypothetical protein